jgi:hypothetical protein
MPTKKREGKGFQIFKSSHLFGRILKKCKETDFKKYLTTTGYYGGLK